MGPLKEYTVTKHGVETTMLLNEADAKRLGVAETDDDDASTKADQPTQPITAAARATRNKARYGAVEKG